MSTRAVRLSQDEWCISERRFVLSSPLALTLTFMMMIPCNDTL